jgi:hypothetical protein
MQAGPWALSLMTRMLAGRRDWMSYRNATMRKSRGRHRFQDEGWFQNLPQEHKDYVASNLANSTSYRFAGAYRGKILLVRLKPSTRLSIRSYAIGRLGDYGWGRITGASVDVTYVDGDHSTIMMRPDVVQVASALRAALKTVVS